MIYVIAFLVFVVPIFLAFFLTSGVSRTVKIAGIIGLIVFLIVVPVVMILAGQV